MEIFKRFFHLPGLFLGFSMISIAELFYFICIRPHCISRHGSRRVRPRQLNTITDSLKSVPRKLFAPLVEDDDYIPTIYLE